MFNNPFSRPAQPLPTGTATPAPATATGLTSNTGAVVPFTSQQPVSTSLFGGSAGAFGSTSTSGAQQNSLFGVAPSSATTTTSNPFGSAFKPANPAFGGTGTVSNTPSAISATTTTTGAAAPSFGSVPFGSTTPSTSIFGGGSAPSAPASASLLGGSTSSTTAPTSFFGGTTTASPAPTTSLFGMNQSAPAQSSAFGSTSGVAQSSTFPGSNGLFGSTPSASTPSFGSALQASSMVPPTAPSSIFQIPTTTPAFGSAFPQQTSSSTSATSFPQSTLQPSSGLAFQKPASFGTASSSQYGGSSSIFGGATTTAPSTTSSLFGAQMAPTSGVFGGGSGTAPQPQPTSSFTGQPQPFGSTGGLFGSSTLVTQQSPFQQQQTALPFGGSASSLSFGITPSLGTGNPPYATTMDMDNQTTLHLQSISAMPAYVTKSVEELRLEDYHRGKKAPGYGSPGIFAPAATASFGTTPTSSSAFGSAEPPSSGFGQPASGFGSLPSNAPFGGGNTSVFGGASAAQPATSIFGTALSQQTQPQSSMTGSIFSSAQPASTTAATAPFSSTAFQPSGGNASFQSASFQQPTTSGSIFGAFPTTAASAAPASSVPSFGTTPFASSIPASAGGGLFGQQTQLQPQQPTSSVLGSMPFGATQQTPLTTTSTLLPSAVGTTGATLFPQQKSSISGSLFSQPQASTSTTIPSALGTTLGIPSLGAPTSATSSTTPAPSAFSFQLPPSMGSTPISSSLPSSSLASTAGRSLGTNANAPLTPFTQPWQTPAVASSSTGGASFPSIASGIPSSSAGRGGEMAPKMATCTQFGRHPWLDAPSTPTTSQPLPSLATITTTTPSSKMASSSELQAKIGKSSFIQQPTHSNSTTHQPISMALTGLSNGSLASISTLRPVHPNLPSSALSVKRSLKTLVVDLGEDFQKPVSDHTNSSSSEDRNHVENGAHRHLEKHTFLDVRVTPNDHLHADDDAQESVLNGSRSRVQSLPGGFYISPPVTEILAAAKKSKTPLIIKELLLGRRHFGDVSFLSPVLDISSFIPTTDERAFLLRLFGREAVSSVNAHSKEDDIENNPIVSFGPRSITIYPEGTEKPLINTGLNLPARIRLEGCYPRRSHNTDGQVHDSSLIEAFVKKLRSVPGTTFLSYEEATGLWVFSVEHF